LDGIEIDVSLPPYVFKAQLYDLTGVPPERQKIMVKGGLLKVTLDSLVAARVLLNAIL
jgi:ubiquitin carboxyl-terminal hydrolase 14